MYSLMMNSIRASPTPSLGRNDVLKARSGFPRLIMICVRGRARSPTSVRSTWKPTAPSVHAARITLGARHRDDRAIGHTRGRVAGAHHRGDAEFAGDDRRVAGATAAVGDDRRGGLHDRLPVGCGGVGDQYLAGLEFRQVREVLDPFHRTRGDPFADRAALGEYLAAAFEHIGLQRRHAVLGGHRLRAGLDDVELSVDTVLGPLHVHRPARSAARSHTRSRPVPERPRR